MNRCEIYKHKKGFTAFTWLWNIRKSRSSCF